MDISIIVTLEILISTQLRPLPIQLSPSHWIIPPRFHAFPIYINPSNPLLSILLRSKRITHPKTPSILAAVRPFNPGIY
ncbi:hypothetical protein L1887_35931 [Cichorium endivia]|nr:hypothetical protein L1887_35931 [Cichorium endivia]